MKICFMNHFQTNLEADIFFACLPVIRPILHPGKILPKNRHIILEIPRQAANQNHQQILIVKPNKNDNLKSSSDDCPSDTEAREEFQIEWTHCDFSRLAFELTSAFEEQGPSPDMWRIISFSKYQSAAGMWVFKKLKPVVYIPLDIPSAIVIENREEKFWNLRKDEILLFTLKNYLEVLANNKMIFHLDDASPDNLKLLALIRTLMEDVLLYGFADCNENLKHLKYFRFLTHDTPVSERVTISDLQKMFSYFMLNLDGSACLSKKFNAYLKKFS